MSGSGRSSGSGNGSSGGSATTTLMEERKRNVLLQNVRLAQMDGAKKKQVFTGLESLMKSASESLIPSSASKPTYTSQNNTTNAGAATNSKKRKHDQHQNDQHPHEHNSVDIYASVVMTKEARAREQREKEEEEARVRRQRQANLEKIKQQRIEQVLARQALQNQWKAVETVASSMRHAYRLDQAERWLFDETEDGRQKKNTLDYLGLVKKGLPPNDHLANNLLTVDVIEI